MAEKQARRNVSGGAGPIDNFVVLIVSLIALLVIGAGFAVYIAYLPDRAASSTRQPALRTDVPK
jgi:hypothetical protein